MCIDEHPFSTSTVYFEDASFHESDTVTNREVISATSFQKDSPKIEAFDYSSYEACILKSASEITIVDSMIFDDHSKLDLSSMHTGSQDDWSHD